MTPIPRKYYNITVVYKDKFNTGLKETNRIIFDTCTITRKEDCFQIYHCDRHNPYEVIIPVHNVLYIKKTEVPIDYTTREDASG